MRTIYPNVRAVLIVSLTMFAALFLIYTQYHQRRDLSTSADNPPQESANLVAGVPPLVPRDLNVRAKLEKLELSKEFEPPPLPQNVDFIDEPRKQPDEGNVEGDEDTAGEKKEQIADEKPVVPQPPKPSAEDEENAERREKVKSMMKYAWLAYKNYSWGANELRPIAKTGHSQSIFGGAGMAATIVDGADTLWIMGLKDEYQQARDYIRDNFTMQHATGTLSVFETTIRFVGGLLSLYGLTKEPFYLEKARSVADTLLPAFNTPTGIAKSLVTPSTNVSTNYGWASGGSSILSEFGSLHLEFLYLSEATGDPKYRQKVEKIRDVLNQAEKPNGLYPNYMSPDTGKFTGTHVSLGALGDSFYEYLIKSWIQLDKNDKQSYEIYKNASAAIQNHMVFTSPGGLRYVAELRSTRPEHKMGHLACFCPGMFALEAEAEQNAEEKAKVMKLAEDLADTCHESYIRTTTGIGPEMFYFNNPQKEAMTEGGDSGYIQRPEVIEGWFYLWRITKNKKYKEWVWNATMAIEKHCRTDSGYAGLRNVYRPEDGFDDVQQSFFLAETLKYAYLTFADNEIPLNKWVFNTEAHPFPIGIDAMRSHAKPALEFPVL